jgi:hypothetical protein
LTKSTILIEKPYIGKSVMVKEEIKKIRMADKFNKKMLFEE